MSEIRLRDVTPQLLKIVDQLKKDYKEVQATTAVERLIVAYPMFMETVSQQAAEIRKLNNELAFYRSVDGQMKSAVQGYLRNLQQQAQLVTPVLKGLIRRKPPKKKPAKKKAKVKKISQRKSNLRKAAKAIAKRSRKK